MVVHRILTMNAFISHQSIPFTNISSLSSRPLFPSSCSTFTQRHHTSSKTFGWKGKPLFTSPSPCTPNGLPSSPSPSRTPTLPLSRVVTTATTAAVAASINDAREAKADDAIPTTNWQQILQGVHALAQPLWNSDRRNIAILWTLATVILASAVTAYAVLLSLVKKFFWNCLAAKDVSKFGLLLAVYIVTVSIGPFIEALFTWVQARLSLMWRRSLTEDLLARYFSDMKYYKLSVGLLSSGLIDNPDQRISDNVIMFTNRAVSFITAFGVAIFDLIVFSVILHRIYAPLFYTLIVYAAVGTGGIAFAGKDLLKLNRQQVRREGDFRYGLVRVRETTESVAFYAGEKAEQTELERRLSNAFDNMIKLLGLQRTVEFLATAFRYIAQVLPTAVIAPRYFSGAVKLGVISQVYSAFNKVLSSLGLFVQEFQGLAEFSSCVRRLKDLSDVLDENEKERQLQSDLIEGNGKPTELNNISCEVDENETADKLILQNVTVNTPGDAPKTLVRDVSISVSSGERLLVAGPSGFGKSSLLRAICGLWSCGSGRIIRPNTSNSIFLPQRPFVMLGTLRENIVYPGRQNVTDEQVEEALRRVNLGYLLERDEGLDQGGESLSRRLSLGEQQRLAFARIVVGKPKFVVLDESTSALDLENERKMYDIVKNLGVTCVSVGNRPSLLDFHDQVLRIEGEGKWNISTPRDAKDQQKSSVSSFQDDREI